jgi:hypothetical protein
MSCAKGHARDDDTDRAASQPDLEATEQKRALNLFAHAAGHDHHESNHNAPRRELRRPSRGFSPRATTAAEIESRAALDAHAEGNERQRKAVGDFVRDATILRPRGLSHASTETTE